MDTKKSLLKKRNIYAPFEYPTAYEYWEKQQQAHWLHSEINMGSDIQDWKLIKEFFESNSHKGYPFNFDFYKWGVTCVDTIQLADLNLQEFELIKDKLDRTIDGINHGRIIYRDTNKNRYIKIFNKQYCRLKNFQDAITGGLFNGLVPALESLIYDGDML